MVATLITTLCLVLPRDPEPDDGSYTISRSQLVAMQTLAQARGDLIYAWDRQRSVPWEWIPENVATRKSSHHPVYGFDGNAWHTTDSTLEALTSFPDLRYLHLAYCCRITDDGIRHLRRLRSLRTLVLYRTHPKFGGNLLPVGYAGIKSPKQLLTDSALVHIATLPSLESLHIGDNKFSEAAILRLAQLKSLKYLTVDDSQLSDAAFARLKQAMPNCEIKVWHGRRPLHGRITK